LDEILDEIGDFGWTKNDILDNIFLLSLTIACDLLLYQSIQDGHFDNLSAIYFLLLDRWRRHNSQKSDSGDSQSKLPMRTERRSSITTGKGWFLLFCLDLFIHTGL